MREDIRKKVLFVIWGLKPGGAERVFVNIVNHIKLFNPIIVVLNKKEGFAKDIKKNIRVIYYNKKGKLDIFKILLKLSKFIKEENIDLMVSFGYYANHISLIAKIISRKRVPICISERIDTKLFLESLRFKVIREILIKKLYKKANKIIAVSNNVKEKLIKYYNIEERKIKTIYNPIDLKKITEKSFEKVNHKWFNKKNIIIISVGRLHPQKNFETLIKAFYQLRKEHKNLKLIIIGEGPEHKKLNRMINEYKLNEYAELLGFQENPYKFMRQSDIYVLSSIYEGFPNVILEAMACGLPVVSTECASEIIIDKVNGFLVPPKNSKLLADAIEELIIYPELREKFSLENLKKIKNFSLELIVNKFEKEFLNLLKNE